MVVGIVKDELMVRLPKDEDEALSRHPHLRPMDFTGKRMRGFYFVRPAGLKTAAALKGWLARCSKYVATLPPKI